MRKPVAYVRKSVVHKDSRIISPEVQEAEVRKLAERYGESDPLILSDIGRSGRKKEKRPDYQRLLAMIEAGQVSAVYAYSMSRLSRSVKDYAALSELCVEHRVPVRFYKEGEQDYTTATGRLIAGVLAHISAFVADIASEQAKETIAAKTANGEHHGERPYGYRDGESMDAVVDAYRQAGSLHGTARILNANGTPTRRGQPWRATTVRVLLDRHRPGVLPPNREQRVKTAPKFRLARLLRCPCGRTLTAVNQSGRPRYVCTQAFDGNAHPWPKSISESRLLAWMMDEADRLHVPFDAIEQAAADSEAERLRARLANLSRQHEMGVIDDAELQARASDVHDALERLQTAAQVLDVPPSIEWNAWAPEQVNASLRALWEYVTLGDDLLPVRAEWRVPEWRS